MLKGRLMRLLVRIRARVPFGLRSVLGLLFLCGGLLAFLPVFGLWMIPMGLMIIALDLSEWRRGARPRRPRPGRRHRPL
jgi:hypothetical protein